MTVQGVGYGLDVWRILVLLPIEYRQDLTETVLFSVGTERFYSGCRAVGY
jgi:hypothetical protein